MFLLEKLTNQNKGIFIRALLLLLDLLQRPSVSQVCPSCTWALCAGATHLHPMPVSGHPTPLREACHVVGSVA